MRKVYAGFWPIARPVRAQTMRPLCNIQNWMVEVFWFGPSACTASIADIISHFKDTREQRFQANNGS